MPNEAEFVAIRRVKDGLYYQGNKGWRVEAKFLPLRKARLVVRIDLGLDYSDVEFVSRDEVKHLKY